MASKTITITISKPIKFNIEKAKEFKDILKKKQNYRQKDINVRISME